MTIACIQVASGLMLLSKALLVIACFSTGALIILLNKYLTHQQISSRSVPWPAHNCSFDQIAACQSSGPGTNGTLLYIMWHKAGFGSELNQLSLAFAYSIESKRQFFIDTRRWNYGNFSEYFHLGTDGFDHSLNYTMLVGDNRRNRLVEHLKTTRTGPQIVSFRAATREVQTLDLKRRVAHFLWQRMTAETSSFVEKCRLRNLSNYMAVHVRRGDKIAREAREVSVRKYIDRMEAVLAENESPTVFVASDDPLAIDEFRRLKPRWTFTAIQHPRQNKARSRGHLQARFDLLPPEEKQLQTRLLICELQMLVDARYVFCTMSSNVCRLVQILRHQHPATAISLDVAWFGT